MIRRYMHTYITQSQCGQHLAQLLTPCLYTVTVKLYNRENQAGGGGGLKYLSVDEPKVVSRPHPVTTRFQPGGRLLTCTAAGTWEPPLQATMRWIPPGGCGPIPSRRCCNTLCLSPFSIKEKSRCGCFVFFSFRCVDEEAVTGGAAEGGRAGGAAEGPGSVSSRVHVACLLSSGRGGGGGGWRGGGGGGGGWRGGGGGGGGRGGGFGHGRHRGRWEMLECSCQDTAESLLLLPHAPRTPQHQVHTTPSTHNTSSQAGASPTARSLSLSSLSLSLHQQPVDDSRRVHARQATEQQQKNLVWFLFISAEPRGICHPHTFEFFIKGIVHPQKLKRTHYLLSPVPMEGWVAGSSPRNTSGLDI